MPETAVHKNYRPQSWQHNVGFTNQVARVKSVAKTQAMHHLANGYFWCRIL
jgi:hypothetical protein